MLQSTYALLKISSFTCSIKNRRRGGERGGVTAAGSGNKSDGILFYMISESDTDID
jgi:hypothetical protein